MIYIASANIIKKDPDFIFVRILFLCNLFENYSPYSLAPG